MSAQTMTDPFPAEHRVIRVAQVDLGAQPGEQVELELAAAADQVDRWTEIGQPEIGEAETATQSEHQTLAGRLTPAESCPLQKVSQGSRAAVTRHPVGVVEHYPSGLVGDAGTCHISSWSLASCAS